MNQSIEILTTGHIGPIYVFGNLVGHVADVRLFSFTINDN